MRAIQVLVALYAVFLIAGGVMGYTRSRSAPSLIAGVLFGALELGVFALAFFRPVPAFAAGAALAGLLAVSTVPRYLKRPSKFMPAGLLLLVSVLVAIALAFGAIRTV
jgi:uncharacterized membrane protein (UPF0136 family)